MSFLKFILYQLVAVDNLTTISRLQKSHKVLHKYTQFKVVLVMVVPLWVVQLTRVVRVIILVDLFLIKD